MDVAEDDRTAVDLLRAGDRAGFDLAYARYRDAIYAFLLRVSGRRDVADDLFQETWLRLARSAAALRPDSDLRAWLFSVARNAFRSFLRRARAASSEPELTDGGIDPASVSASLGFSDLERGLLALSLDDRELLLLVSVQGLDHAALAELLGIDTAAVRQRLSRARSRLARALEIEPASQRRRSSGT